MRLWIESAHQSLSESGEDVCGDAVRIFTTEEQFCAILASCPSEGDKGTRGQGDQETRTRAARIADGAAEMLARGMPLDAVVETVLAALPEGEHAPLAILQVFEGGDAPETGGGTLTPSPSPCQGEGKEAHLVECDAPPLFLTRGGRLVLLPVLEDEWRGHLVRRCRFSLQAGDHAAMVSEGYIAGAVRRSARARRTRSGDQPERWSARWGWRDVAMAVRRWTDTGCDAGQLLGALVRTYHRLAEGPALRPGSEQARRDVTVIAMHVRPERTVTIWSGPPTDPAQDAAALEKLMAEPGTRVICGDTTAQIAARLLGADLRLESRPAGGWAEVPPVSRLEGVALVTEGLVTLGIARERMARAEQVRDLPRQEDGATRLARVLLSADRVHLIVGLAVNPAQATLSQPLPEREGGKMAAQATLPQPLPEREGGKTVSDVARAVPLRRAVVEELLRDLQARGKLVSVEYL